MATTGCRSHESWILLLQLIMQILISTLHVILGQEIAAGSLCLTGQTCVDHASCISYTCVCDSTHYESLGVCLNKVAAGTYCTPGQTCVDHASCISHRCECDSNHYESLGFCLNKVAAGSFCITGQTCVDHASCISYTCVCDNTHYESLGVCLNKVAAGTYCTPGQTCVDHASCISHRCECDNTYYESLGDCLYKVAAGTYCTPGQTCVDHASCISHRCECDSNHYESLGFCLNKVAAGSFCITGQTCVDHASCISYTCVCDNTHYESLGVCLNKVAAGTYCTPGQTCVDHASCMSYTCVCDNTYYESLGDCLYKVAAGTYCTPGQTCVDHASCISHRCECDSNHYESLGFCLNKVAAGSLCTTGQTCVDHASCISYRCVCDNTHYESSGVCLNKKVAAGSFCTSGDTCVDHASCMSYRCVCDNTHYESLGVCLHKGSADTSCTPGQTCLNNGENVGAIVGGVFGGLAVLIIVLFIIMIVLRRCKRRSEGAQGIVLSRKRLSDRHSTKLRDFITRLAILHLDSNHRFQEEFDELCSSHRRQALQFTMGEGSKPVNRVKNRSQYALPYDHSRVVLINSKDSGQDYINASYITVRVKYFHPQGADSPCEYIATQAPLYSTLSDFWRMVYEHRTGVIVMLCDSVENGKKMVDPYWPDELNVPVRHGDLTVTMTGVSVLDVYTVRKMTVTMRERQDLRVTQFCVRGWSGYGCLPVEKLIDFIRVAGRQAKTSRGPVTVHCNLGVGRTGLFIALDLLTRFVEKHNLNSEVNVYDVVKRMLRGRPYIIQSLDQYMFVHDVLGVIIEKKNGSRGMTSGVFYQNEGHTVNVYNELYEHIGEGKHLQRY